MIRVLDHPCVLDLFSAAVRHVRCSLWAIMALASIGPEAHADTSCRGGQSFDTWLGEFRREAARQGVSAQALAALDGITHDGRVLRQDRGQPTLSQSFLEFAGRVVS